MLLLVLGRLIVDPAPAFAVHDAQRMELDGNATNGSASGTDWGPVMPSGATNDVTAVFVKDSEPADTSYFTGGGSKDTNDVTEWAVTTGDVAPDKNEITNAYAIAYRNQVDTGSNDVGDLLFYFGADRLANDGDAQMGFWFFRNTVGISGSNFTGAHAVGDILVLAHFTNGGRVSTAEVFRWVGSGGSHGSLDLLATGQECGGSLSDDKVCSIANESNANAPWAYEPKRGASNVFPANSFYEGGLNISRLVPGVECFSSMLAETRSSSSTGAQLKDFALGTFDTCPPKPKPAPKPDPEPDPKPEPKTEPKTEPKADPKPRTRTVTAAPPPARVDEPETKIVYSPDDPLAASGPEDAPGFAVAGLLFLAMGIAMRRYAVVPQPVMAAARRLPQIPQRVPYWIEQDRRRRRLR